MNYGDLEIELIQRLAPLASAGYQVIEQPETESDFQKSVRKGRVTVGYIGSSFPAIRSTGGFNTIEDIMFGVSVQARMLRGPGGVFAIMKATRDLLLDWATSHTEPLRIKSSDYVPPQSNETDGMFTFDLVFYGRMLIMGLGDENNDVLIKSITVGDTETVAPAVPGTTRVRVLDSNDNELTVVDVVDGVETVIVVDPV